MGNCFISAINTAEGKTGDVVNLLNKDKILGAIERACLTAEEVKLNEESKIIIFSDMHRVTGDKKIDQFLSCKDVYINALDYYKQYTLIHLGDIEDTWYTQPAPCCGCFSCLPCKCCVGENVADIISAHQDVYDMEKKMFYDKGRMHKVIGNHDDVWQDEANVKKYLDPIFKGINVVEALKLNWKGKYIYTMHGHQGQYDNVEINTIAKCCLQTCFLPILTCCNVDKKSIQTPATNVEISTELDKIITELAGENLARAFILGHTHHPVIHTHSEKCDSMRDEVKHHCLEKDGGNYFNTGSCIFDNGMITGIEISNSSIKLVIFKRGEDKPHIINEVLLDKIFSLSMTDVCVSAAAPNTVSGKEKPLYIVRPDLSEKKMAK